MTRGNQREINRQRALSRKQKAVGNVEKKSANFPKQKESDAEIMRKKQEQ